MGRRAKREAARAVRTEENDKAAAELARQREEKVTEYLAMSPEDLHRKAVDAYELRTREAWTINRSRATTLDQLALVAIKGRPLLESSSGDSDSLSVQLHREAVGQFVDGELQFNEYSTRLYDRANELCRLAIDAQNQEGVVSGVASLMERMGVRKG